MSNNKNGFGDIKQGRTLELRSFNRVFRRSHRVFHPNCLIPPEIRLWTQLFPPAGCTIAGEWSLHVDESGGELWSYLMNGDRRT